MQLHPQASYVRLEGDACSLTHDLARGVVSFVDCHSVPLEEHGEEQDCLLQGKLPADAPAHA